MLPAGSAATPAYAAIVPVSMSRITVAMMVRASEIVTHQCQTSPHFAPTETTMPVSTEPVASGTITVPAMAPMPM